MRIHAPCAGLRKAGGRNPDNGFCRCAGRLVEGVFTVNAVLAAFHNSSCVYGAIEDIVFFLNYAPFYCRVQGRVIAV